MYRRVFSPFAARWAYRQHARILAKGNICKRKIHVKTFLALIITSIFSVSALAGGLGGLGGMANGYNGFQQGMQQEELRQCMRSCSRGDGQCYQGCSAGFGQQPSQPAVQTFQPPAYFTGQQENADSVTGLSITRCQYDYFGRKFWHNIRSGSCPSTLAVD